VVRSEDARAGDDLVDNVAFNLAAGPDRALPSSSLLAPYYHA
jgi:hypothetical protein